MRVRAEAPGDTERRGAQHAARPPALDIDEAWPLAEPGEERRQARLGVRLEDDERDVADAGDDRGCPDGRLARRRLPRRVRRSLASRADRTDRVGRVRERALGIDRRPTESDDTVVEAEPAGQQRFGDAARSLRRESAAAQAREQVRELARPANLMPPRSPGPGVAGSGAACRADTRAGSPPG